MVRNPLELRMTCGWHKVCAGDNVAKHSDRTGFDIGGFQGLPQGWLGENPVLFSVSNESTGRAPVKAMPQYVTATRYNCKKVMVDIVGIQSNQILWRLLYTHVVIPWFPSGRRLADIPVSSTDGVFTIRQIGQVAYAPDWRQAAHLSDNSENCENNGAHLHQGHSRTIKSDEGTIDEKEIDIGHGMTMNIDPDIGRVDCVTDSVDNEGLPTRKLFQTDDTDDGECENDQVLGEYVDNGVARYDEETDESCLWSDVWVFAFGNKYRGPTDRAFYGPNKYQVGVDGNGDPRHRSYCPLRFIPETFADQSWVYGQEISLQLPAARGGDKDGPISYDIDCAGLSFDAPTRTLSGIPDAAGGGECTLRATDILKATKGGWPSGAKAAELTAELTFSYDMVAGIFPISNSGPPPTGLRLGAGNDRLNLSFVSARATEFELYREKSGGFCAPGAAGCSADEEASAPAVAAAARTASFEKQPSGVYRARGRSCSGGPSGASGAGGAGGASGGTVCGPWGAWSPEFTHRVPSFGDNVVISDQAWTKGTDVSLTLPSASGGDVAGAAVGASGGGTLRYTLTPAFPKDVKRTNTFTASGAPKAVQTATTHTWTAADDDGDTASLTFTVTVAAAPSCTLTVRVSPSGGGTTSPSAGAHRYSPCPSSVSIEAIPNSNYRFGSWSGTGVASASSSSTTVAMNGGDRTVTASFTKITSCTLTVKVSPSGGGTTSPSAGTHRYSPCPSSVSLSASANSGYSFKHWSGAVSSTSATTSVAMRDGDNKIVTAKFTKKCALTVGVNPTAGGTTSPSAKEHNYNDCPSIVNLSASANSGYSFKKWSGDASGTSATTSVTMNGSDKAVTAHFTKNPTSCTLTVRVSPSGGGTTTPAVGSRTHSPCPSSVSIEATPNSNFRFSSWSGAGVANASSRSTTVAMNGGDRTVTANFATECTLTVGVTPSTGGTTTPAVGSRTHSPCPERIGLSASANSNFRFKEWSGAGVANTSSASTHVTMNDGDRTITAKFRQTECNLTVRVVPSGSGTTSPSAGPHSYRPCPPKINLSVTPNSARYFYRWYGGVASASSASTHVTMSDGANKTVTAYTRPYLSVSPSASPSSWGTVSGGGSNKYRSGDSVTLRATAKVPASGYGYYFRHWKERTRIVSTSSTWTFKVYFNRSPVAVFDSVCNTEFPCGWAADDTPP